MKANGKKQLVTAGDWMRGAICAICIMIRNEGLVTTPIRDTAIAVGVDMSKLDLYGLPESDIETLTEHRQSLI